MRPIDVTNPAKLLNNSYWTRMPIAIITETNFIALLLAMPNHIRCSMAMRNGFSVNLGPAISLRSGVSAFWLWWCYHFLFWWTSTSIEYALNSSHSHKCPQGALHAAAPLKITQIEKPLNQTAMSCVLIYWNIQAKSMQPEWYGQFTCYTNKTERIRATQTHFFTHYPSPSLRSIECFSEIWQLSAFHVFSLRTVDIVCHRAGNLVSDFNFLSHLYQIVNLLICWPTKATALQ